MIGVISGPVNSGKTKELIHQGTAFKGKVKTFQLKRSGVEASIKAKDGIIQIPCELIATPWFMMVHAQELPPDSMIMIEDGHLFDYDLVHVCLKMSFEYNHCVMVAGRSQDWLGRPIDVMRDLLVVSDQVMKLYGICKFCSKPYGSKTIEVSTKRDESIAVLDAELFSIVEECACNQCYKALMDQNKAPYVGKVSPAEVAKHNAKTKRRKSVQLELIPAKLES